jgi:hypothetical protein
MSDFRNLNLIVKKSGIFGSVVLLFNLFDHEAVRRSRMDSRNLQKQAQRMMPLRISLIHQSLLNKFHLFNDPSLVYASFVTAHEL